MPCTKKVLLSENSHIVRKFLCKNGSKEKNESQKKFDIFIDKKTK